jgi:mannose-1-phosphate guanylyltransferase / mannose-6-phosphate isomerase
VEVIATRNTLVRSDGVITAVVGLEGVVVVTSPDAVLVATQNGSERIRDLVDSLRPKKRLEADEHLRVYRPWGWYERTDSGGRFQVKRIMVIPGGRLSLQKHFHRAEHWVVVHVTVEVTVDDDVTLVYEN